MNKCVNGIPYYSQNDDNGQCHIVYICMCVCVCVFVCVCVC